MFSKLFFILYLKITIFFKHLMKKIWDELLIIDHAVQCHCHCHCSLQSLWLQFSFCARSSVLQVKSTYLVHTSISRNKELVRWNPPLREFTITQENLGLLWVTFHVESTIDNFDGFSLITYLRIQNPGYFSSIICQHLNVNIAFYSLFILVY